MSWDIRAAVRNNAEALEALAGGATSLLLQTDDIEDALRDVILEAAPAALDAGADGPDAARRLAEAAKGSPAARLAFHLDPLTASAPIEEAAAVAAALAPAFPAASLFLASGRAAHEAGGSDAQELGLMAAAALAYAKAMVEAGMAPEAAFGGIALGLAVDGAYLRSIAKLRAARAIWARLTAACGIEAPARIEGRSSGRMLTALDPWTNLLRLTAAGFAGAAGGADALVLGGFTDALGAPGERARRLSRNIQLILMQESHLGVVEDPAAGAFEIEAMTGALAREGWAEFQKIEAAGGAVEALAGGAFAAEVEAVRIAREAAVAEGETRIVGVNLYPDPEPVAVEVEGPWPPAPLGPLAPVRTSAHAEQVLEDLQP